MTQEEKAKAYDEAIKKAKTLYENANGMILKKWVEQIFPELTESENERIRKAMIDFFKHEREEGISVLHYGVNIERMIAWLEKQGNANKEYWRGYRDGKQEILDKYAELEKQGEQKPTWSEEDEIGLVNALWCCKQAASIAKDENDMGNVWYAERWLKSLKDRVQPKQEWSEEDNIILSRIIADYERSNEEWFNAQNSLPHGRKITWLKSLRPQTTWKPSDEQINALEHFVRSVGESGYASPYDNDTKLIYSLLEQLKQL